MSNVIKKKKEYIFKTLSRLSEIFRIIFEMIRNLYRITSNYVLIYSTYIAYCYFHPYLLSYRGRVLPTK